MSELTQNQYVSIDVTKKKKKFGPAVGNLLGGIGVIIGTLLCLTVIGILIGIPLIIGSIALIVHSKGFQLVNCPSCNKKQKVLQTQENFDCEKCRQFSVINWK